MTQTLITLFIIIVAVILVNNYVKKRKLDTEKVNDENQKPYKFEASKEQLDLQNKMLNQTKTEFKNQLNDIKKTFPFDYWYDELFKEYEMEQYTLENCKKAENIMNTLIEDLTKIGLNASESLKLEKFKKAVLEYNKLNEENDSALIETGEREDLCEIMDRIGVICGLIPEKYGEGDGIASEWREW